MVWVLVVAVWVALGALTAVVAERRDHDRVLWLVLGLVFPGAALLALLLGFPRTQSTRSRLAPDLLDALRHSRVARTLHDRSGLDEEAVQAATGLPEDRVASELRTLRVLGLVRRGRDRTWSLAPRAAAALDDDGPGEAAS